MEQQQQQQPDANIGPLVLPPRRQAPNIGRCGVIIYNRRNDGDDTGEERIMADFFNRNDRNNNILDDASSPPREVAKSFRETKTCPRCNRHEETDEHSNLTGRRWAMARSGMCMLPCGHMLCHQHCIPIHTVDNNNIFAGMMSGNRPNGARATSPNARIICPECEHECKAFIVLLFAFRNERGRLLRGANGPGMPTLFQQRRRTLPNSIVNSAAAARRRNSGTPFFERFRATLENAVRANNMTVEFDSSESDTDDDFLEPIIPAIPGTYVMSHTSSYIEQCPQMLSSEISRNIKSESDILRFKQIISAKSFECPICMTDYNIEDTLQLQSIVLPMCCKNYICYGCFEGLVKSSVFSRSCTLQCAFCRARLAPSNVIIAIPGM